MTLMTPSSRLQTTPDRPMLIGLTGGIGSGKSTALRLLAELGCATLSTDEVVHAIQTRPQTIDAMVERFGDQIAVDGELDRAEVARIIFADEKERAWLEGLIWPQVGGEIARWGEEAAAATPKPRALVVEVPLLFESGMDQAFDQTICISAQEEVRAERAASRGHEAVEERASRQLSPDEKASRATWVIANDGSTAQLKDELSLLLGRIGV